MRHRILFGLLLISYIAIQAHAGEQKPLMAGTDVSMLPEIEHAGGVYRNSDGKPGDAIAILRKNQSTRPARESPARCGGRSASLASARSAPGARSIIRSRLPAR